MLPQVSPPPPANYRGISIITDAINYPRQSQAPTNGIM